MLSMLGKNFWAGNVSKYVYKFSQKKKKRFEMSPKETTYAWNDKSYFMGKK